MNIISSIILACALVVSPLAQAINAVMYQPQLRDMTMSDLQWQTMLRQLKNQGIDTLVIQWSRYGDAFTQGESRHWLEHKVSLVNESDLALVLGLAADDRFFERQKQPLPARVNYLNHLRANDIAVAKRWVEVLGAKNIAGWYISSELDDMNWRTPQMQQVAQEWLTKTRQSLSAVADKPVAVSSFFAGNMEPTVWGQWVSLLRQSGVKVWVQDGAGTQVLHDAARKIYLKAPVSGTIVELFRQKKGTATFSAEALNVSQQQQWLATSPPAGQDRIFFSLRYLDVAKGVLKI